MKKLTISTVNELFNLLSFNVFRSNKYFCTILLVLVTPLGFSFTSYSESFPSDAQILYSDLDKNNRKHIGPNAEEIKSDEYVPQIIYIKKPFYQKPIRKQRIKNDHVSIEQFKADLFLNNNNIKVVDEVEKKGKITKIVVIDVSAPPRILKRNFVEESIKIYIKYYSELNYPYARPFFAQVFYLADDINAFNFAIQNMPDSLPKEIIQIGHKRFVKTYTNLKKAINGFRNLSGTKEDFVWITWAKGIADLIKNEQDIILFFENFPGWADTYAILRISDIMGCEYAIELIEQKSINASIPSLEHIYACGCMNSLEDFYNYILKFPNGRHQQEAFEKALIIALREGKLFQLMKEYRFLVDKYPKLTKKYALQEINDLTSALDYIEFFNAKNDIQEVIYKLIGILSPTEFEVLFKNPRLAPEKCQYQGIVWSLLDNTDNKKLELVMSFINIFKDCGTDVITKSKYRYVMREAKDGNNWEILKKAVIDFRFKYDSFEEITEFINEPNIVFAIAIKYSDFRIELKPFCLRNVDTYERYRYAVNIYGNSEELVNIFLDRIASADELQKLIEKDNLHISSEIVENKHFSLITKLEHALWHYGYFSPLCRDNLELLEMIIKMSSIKKDWKIVYQFLPIYMSNGGDLDLVSELLTDCDTLLNFVKNHEKFRNKLKPLCETCLTLRTVPVFKAIYPEIQDSKINFLYAKNIEKIGLDILKKVESSKIKKTITPKVGSNDDIVLSDSSTTFITFRGDFSDLNIELKDCFTNHTFQSIKKSVPLYLIDKSQLSGQYLTIEIHNNGQVPKNIEIAIFELPKSLTYHHIKTILLKSKFKKLVFKYSGKLIDSKIFRNSVTKDILGDRLYQKLEPLPEEDTKELAKNVMERFYNIFEYMESQKE